MWTQPANTENGIHNLNIYIKLYIRRFLLM